MKTSGASFTLKSCSFPTTCSNKQQVWLHYEPAAPPSASSQTAGETKAGGTHPPCRAAEIPDVDHLAIAPCQSAVTQAVSVKHFQLQHCSALPSEQADLQANNR